jgi:hypothetical protein
VTLTTTRKPVETERAKKLPEAAGAAVASSSSSSRSHVLAWLALAAIFTGVVINYSLHRGKLALPARYDDVAYLRDGLAKLNLFYAGGPKGLARGIYLNPPHSPWATVAAFAGFAIFGTHDWAPYAVNGIIVLGLLAFADYLTRGVRPWAKAAACYFVLSVPIAAQGVYEFRPDIAVGLMTAVFIVLIIERPLVRASSRYLLLCGALLGLALLAKTSVFPITLTFAASAVVAATIRDRMLFGAEANARSIAGAWGRILAPAVLIPLPFYLLNFREIYYYITVNALGGNSDIWKMHASRAAHLLYYLTGEGSEVMLGQYFRLMAWLFVGGVLAGCIRRRKPEVGRAAGYLFMLAVTYAVPTINPIKDRFLAVTFDFLLIFVSLLIIRECLMARAPAWLRGIYGTALVLFVAAGAWSDKWPIYLGEVDAPVAEMRHRYMRELYQGILMHDPDRTGTVLIGVTGVCVNADSLGYMADKDGLTGLRFVGDFTDHNLLDFQAALDQSNFVIIGDPSNPEDNPRTPFSAMLDQTLPMVRSRRDFELIAVGATRAGKNYFLYQHHPRPTAPAAPR